MFNPRGLALISALMGLAPLHATTLQRLSVGEMTQQSTSIIRARVTGSSAALRGGKVWTFYQVQVLETLKGTSSNQANQVQIAVPGGSASGIRQEVAGAPALATGGEYVLFLWTGRSGLTQVIGLSQGLLSVVRDRQGNTSLVRRAAKEIMLDRNLQPVTDQGVRIGWNDFRALVRAGVKP